MAQKSNLKRRLLSKFVIVSTEDFANALWTLISIIDQFARYL